MEPQLCHGSSCCVATGSALVPAPRAGKAPPVASYSYNYGCRTTHPFASISACLLNPSGGLGHSIRQTCLLTSMFSKYPPL